MTRLYTQRDINVLLAVKEDKRKDQVKALKILIIIEKHKAANDE